MSALTLTLVEHGDHASLYQDREGSEVYLGTGAQRLVTLDDLDLCALWGNRTIDWYSTYDTEQTFKTMLEGLLIDPCEVDEVDFCADCGEPDRSHNLTTPNGSSEAVCESCFNDNYYHCVSCEEHFTQTTTMLNDDEVCECCRDNCYSYCDDCEGYYNSEYDSDEHEHNDGCGCEAPAQRFKVRNDGDPALVNDTSATIGLPAGVVTSEGMEEIRSHILSTSYVARDGTDEGKVYGHGLRQLAYAVRHMDPRWQTKEGNFTKRLSRLAYKSFNIKVKPDLVSTIGNIARAHSVGTDHTVEVTRNLNLPAEDFCHEDSCWWQSYSESRCLLKSNGGFGLRTFIKGHYGRSVNGRAWVMPLRIDDNGDLGPTFDTEDPDAFVVFNGYGDLSGYAAARIMSHMAGMTYRKIGFDCSPMYVNGGQGYLVASEEIASRYTDGSLTLYTDVHSNLYNRETTTLNYQKETANA